ncbi:hypothetical protein QQ054_11230 [Oscillatoria amoena NRMC-F 0135]|nr:hypothetical protein [Oscillatoria laete-virens]MDL5046605.1 hypothetical protein [Oscillatoria amoena NRMC-F 0135]MDL5053594.1 hypothetical protein [Oscillatoria laete-virens NRMC-F 0139]
MFEIQRCDINCPTKDVFNRVYDSLVLAFSPDKIRAHDEFSRLLGVVSLPDFQASLLIVEKQPKISELTLEALRRELDKKQSRLIIYDPASSGDLFSAIMDALGPQTKTRGFVCKLPRLPMTQVIHILCQTGVKGDFGVSEKDRGLSGYFRIEHNQLCAVRTKEQHGLLALRTICSWQEGSVQAVRPESSIFADEDRIEGISTDFLLLQIMHDMDESHA